jgi:hypothetical protein
MEHKIYVKRKQVPNEKESGKERTLKKSNATRSI